MYMCVRVWMGVLVYVWWWDDWDDPLYMDLRTSPVFSSFWGQVYFQAYRHLYCLVWRENKRKQQHLNKCLFNAWLLSVSKGCHVVALLLTQGLRGEDEQKKKSSSSWNHGALPCLRDAESRLIMRDFGNLHLVFLQLTATAPPPPSLPALLAPPASRLQPFLTELFHWGFLKSSISQVTVSALHPVGASLYFWE